MCDRCKDGYYGLTAVNLNGCYACACSVYGSVNSTAICNKQTGACPCKPGFFGRTCSECKPGFYGFPVSLPMECRPCNCHPSGSHNMTCDKSGQCLCRNFYYGIQCEQIRTGYFSPSVLQLQYDSRMAITVNAVRVKCFYILLLKALSLSFYSVIANALVTKKLLECK